MSNWYGVKTLYRWEATGDPVKIDGGYDEEATVLEERVVLIKAVSIDDAIEKAESEANVFSDQNYKNFYGQTVRTRYLGCCDAYDIGEDFIENGVEVFSSRESVRTSIPDSVLIDSRFGKEEPVTDGRAKRDKFWNAELV